MTAYRLSVVPLSVVPGSGALQHRLDHFDHSPSSCGPRRRFAGRVLLKLPLLVAGALGVVLFTDRKSVV